jgi:hypothetical protein
MASTAMTAFVFVPFERISKLSARAFSEFMEADFRELRAAPTTSARCCHV